MSGKELLILNLLDPGKESYGLDLIAISNGALSRGTVYITLAEMEEKGLISSRREGGEPPRRIYKLTSIGLRKRDERKGVS